MIRTLLYYSIAYVDYRYQVFCLDRRLNLYDAGCPLRPQGKQNNEQ